MLGRERAAWHRLCRDDQARQCVERQFDEWDTQRKGLPISAPNMPKYGTVVWLFGEYKISRAYLDKVGVRSRDDYEWAMDQVCNTLTKKVIASAIAL